MRRPFVVLFALAAAIAACHANAPASDAPVAVSAPPPSVTQRAPLDAAVAAAATAPDASPDAAAPATVDDVYAELPPPLDTMDRVVGFSDDDQYLGYEVSTCDPCSAEIHFVSPTKPRIDGSYYYHPDRDQAVVAREQPVVDAAMDRKLAKLGATTSLEGRPLRGPWPYPDLRFAVDASDELDSHGHAHLRFGAHVVGEKPVFPITLAVGPYPLFNDAHFRKTTPKDEFDAMVVLSPDLWYANVTRDGRDLGVVAYVKGMMWWEDASVARMPVKTFVAKVYGETAKMRAARGDASGAKELEDRVRAIEAK